MITIETRNMGGIVASRLELHNKITLVSGRNGQGKSSQADPIKEALSGSYPKNSKEAQEMVREGSTFGVVKISDGERNFEVSYPKCVPLTQGWPEASIYASGKVRFALEKPDVIASYLQKLLKTEPTEIDLGRELNRLGIIAKMTKEQKISFTKAVWSNIERRTWVGAHKEYIERGRNLKAEWKANTTEQWGSNKATTWAPAKWEHLLAAESDESLRNKLIEAEAFHEALIKTEAVEQAELERLEEESKGVSETAKERDAAIIKRDEMEDKLKQMNDAHKLLPRPAAEVKTKKCWNCDCDINVATWGKPPEAQTKEELEKIRQVLADSEEEIRLYSLDYHLAANTVEKLREEFRLKVNAKNRLEELKKKVGSTKPSEAELNESRRNVDIARERYDAWKRKTEADRIHAEIEENQKLIDLLEPEGWRQTFTAGALKILNEEYLKPQCDIAGTPPIEIDTMGNITWGGRSFKRCSKGQKWLINAMFQIALARIEKAHLMVFDDAEKLVYPFNLGFFNLLGSLDIPALVFAAYGFGEKVPKLKDVGHAYWVSDGTSEKIQEAVPA